jgi:hypothetical protein
MLLESEGGGRGVSLSSHEVTCVSLARLMHAFSNNCTNLQLCAIATALTNPDTVRVSNTT